MSRDAVRCDAGPAGLLVVAHPDDETLWLEPWLAPDRTVVVAFPTYPNDSSITAARETIRSDFPYGTMEFLPLNSLDVLGRSDWRRRAPTAYGVELRGDCPPEVRQAYLDNHRSLCDLLDPYLADHAVVYTHNPWGEYGHEEHVQVCRAVLDTGARHGTCVWAWDGLSVQQLGRSSMRLRRDYFERQVPTLSRTARALGVARYRDLKDRYQRAAAWTWDTDYTPPAVMQYIEIMHEGNELLRPVPRARAARAAGILGGHVRRAPAAARRLVTQGRLRSG
jgi:LmbE family N-acetylglucosaminyl deacetylase